MDWISEESKFRELDDEYLEKQTRIWLSEVLKQRLDENQTISDVLANGDMLFDVARALWKFMMEKGVEMENSRIFISTRKSNRHSGKYTPYSNVDAFLKICQIMGLSGADLFSPSDVVERRDARKVCLCIRSLSKKARSMDINIPDFDIATCTITMPTKLIDSIQRSLEFSQCGSVGSDNYSSCIDSDPLSIKTKSTASLESSYNFKLDESDDAESCNVHLSSQMTSDFGDGEAESLYELEDWSVDNEDLDNVHLSIIESFLSTTICSNPVQSFCSENSDELDCWNSENEVLPISSYEDEISLIFPNHAHHANFIQSAKQTTSETESDGAQKACHKVLVECYTNDREYNDGKGPLSHTPVEGFETDRDVDKCVEAKFLEIVIPKNHETGKLNQSKMGKSPILKSIMGGAALLGLGVLAFFLNIRIAEQSKSRKPDQSEPSHISGDNKLSTCLENNGVAKKGVYASRKLKFS